MIPIKHNQHIVLFLGGLLFLFTSNAQRKDERIKLIQEKIKIINKDTTLIKVVLEHEEFLENVTDNGAKLVGYHKNGEIIKLWEWVGLSNGISMKEFYFDKNHLFFVYEKFDSFVFNYKKSDFDFSKTKTIFEGRYYFNSDKLFASSKKGKKTNVAQHESSGQTLLENANENLKLLNKKIL